MASPRDYRQHLEVETPEHVVLDFEIAGLGSRALAALADSAVIAVLSAALLYVSAKLASVFGASVLSITGLALFALLWGYFALFEAFAGGRTPGKRWLGLRVIRDTGHAVTLREAATRNLLRLIDFLPPPYILGILCIAIHPRGKRLGDLVAGTVVVRDGGGAKRAVADPVSIDAQAQGDGAPDGELALTPTAAGGPPVLDDAEFRVVRAFAERAAELPAAVRVQLATPLAARFATRLALRERDPVAFVLELARLESARRLGPLAARARGRHTTAERLIARQSPRWRAFEQLLDRTKGGGLDALTADELPTFAARYREVAADLARARTYRAEPRDRQRLERLVAAGHSLLYRARRRTWRDVGRVVAVECPAAVVAVWPVVVGAWLAFTLPALGGYLTLRQQPALAEQVLPAVLLERAEAGQAARNAGRGYAQEDAALRPLMASRIVTNNVGVAFACFAGGVLLGVGSLLALAFNGLLIGATSAHFHNRGLLDYLWTFVAGHGVLELFAIWCAGAAGFLLGLAVLRPGAYSRRDALVLHARVAMRLVGASVVLLLVAGAIEGFVSASGSAVWVKVAISAGSAVLLALWLAVGARHRHEVGLPPRG